MQAANSGLRKGLSSIAGQQEACDVPTYSVGREVFSVALCLYRSRNNHARRGSHLVAVLPSRITPSFQEDEFPPGGRSLGTWKSPLRLVAKTGQFTGARRHGPRYMYHTARIVCRVMPSNLAAYSATEVIGGKLRALYDDAAQPCPARMIRLLLALDANAVNARKNDCALTQIPHLGTIN